MSTTLIVPREIASRLLDQACVGCRFSYRDPERDLNCRRHPPTIFAFPAMTPTGPGVEFRTVHPIVQDDQWCGEFERRM
jgi:hypothetical protein